MSPRDAGPEPDDELSDLQERAEELFQENKTLKGMHSNTSPELVEELKTKNKELRAMVLQLEKDIFALLLNSQKPVDAAGLQDKLYCMKTVVVNYCVTADVDAKPWKK